MRTAAGGSTHRPVTAKSDPGRLAALELLTSALARRAGLDEALGAGPYAGLSDQDRGFARALVMAALRRLGVIDRALDGRLKRPPPPAVKMILRLGVAQLFFMETPAFAAIDTSVTLAQANPATAPFKNLVNAVLRGLQREGLPPAREEDLAPSWLLARWRAAYGEAAAAMAAVIAQEPATDLSLRDPAQLDELAAALEATILPGGSLRRAGRGRLEDWPGFQEGQWWVQDAAAAVAARLLNMRRGETALDLCAAPGGKTLQLAAAGAEVTALDRSAPRLERVRANLKRTGLTAQTVVGDAGTWGADQSFDAVLLDAPCSATGTFRRNPDLLWTVRPGDIADLAAVQARLIDAAADRVRPGGRMIYSVCSLETEEGEAQIRGFLARRPDFTLVPMTPGEGGAPPASLAPEGWLRILPHHLEGGIDGFFIARFERRPG